MPTRTLPEPLPLEPRAHAETKPLDVPAMRPPSVTGARLAAGIDAQRRIGEGASSLVYRCLDHDGRPLAAKVLRHPCRPSAERRFVLELDVLRRVQSPYVVRVRDHGRLPDGRPWYAMDYLPGRSLAQRLAGGWQPSQSRIVRLLRMACRGLAAIHAAGYVHHDVKPSNLLVSRREGIEHLVVADLGVIEAIGVRPRYLCGTPDYMAPEQAQAGPVDVRSDVYGLGCCAYELLTGHKLVEGPDVTTKIRAHLRGVTPRWPTKPAVAPALRAIVERCLARDPADREPTMLALERALAAVAKDLPPLVRARGRRARGTRRPTLEPHSRSGSVRLDPCTLTLMVSPPEVTLDGEHEPIPIRSMTAVTKAAS
ncbi:serine/threonine-protein kinase [Paraliomyxa miuraensis]|uniref:serine/threonine-protein kinase n=1 Tax=Paraliomyxa miuraensis TaxID=376150 RepID=UPI00224D3681|nr:serine/threonine-protein kinase [Paraliomyxa miuraensis]MCX4242161.1 serine/threonine protein kinase [Paraliomyxa miuraensis]